MSDGDIDPRRLRVLLAVARTGGVLAAADELAVTASAVSQQLARLERETGHRLVRRTPRGTSLTPAGVVLAEAAEEVERALGVARTRMAQDGGELSGRVVLGGFSSVLRRLVVPRLAGWRERHPGLDIRVVEDDLPVLMRRLRRGELDAVVVELDSELPEPPPSGTTEDPLLDEPWRLLVPTGALLGAEGVGGVDLAHLPLPWLGVDTASASGTALARLARSTGVEIAPVHEFYEVITAIALVAAGEGVALVPALALHGMVMDGVDVLSAPGLGTRRIAVRRVARRGATWSPTDDVLRLVREAVGELDLGA